MLRAILLLTQLLASFFSVQYQYQFETVSIRWEECRYLCNTICNAGRTGGNELFEVTKLYSAYRVYFTVFSNDNSIENCVGSITESEVFNAYYDYKFRSYADYEYELVEILSSCAARSEYHLKLVEEVPQRCSDDPRECRQEKHRQFALDPEDDWALQGVFGRQCLDYKREKCRPCKL